MIVNSFRFRSKENTMARDDRAVHNVNERGTDSNPDPLTGQPGAHPVGTGVGAAMAGAAAGDAGGLVGGPIGAAVGAVVGGVAGGLAGKGVAESIDPTVEDRYWRANYGQRPYYDSQTSYDHIRPAYRYGWESQSKHAGRSFDEAEPELARDWEAAKDHAKLTWDKAKHATRDAWNRAEHTVAGKCDSGR
jgi:phage tail tape-measure protein